jgi:hypothetical protein
LLQAKEHLHADGTRRSDNRYMRVVHFKKPGHAPGRGTYP